MLRMEVFFENIQGCAMRSLQVITAIVMVLSFSGCKEDGDNAGQAQFGYVAPDVSGQIFTGPEEGCGEACIPAVGNNVSQPIPEPATIILLGAGIGLAALRKRMRKTE